MFLPNMTSAERLAVWRKMRHQLIGATIEDTVHTFASIKPKTRCIDYYAPESWPTVFEIVQDDLLCQSGLTLVIAATLHYLEIIKTDKIVLPVISNCITGTEGLVLELDKSYINFIPGQIQLIDDTKEQCIVYDKHIISVDMLFR